MLTLIVAAQSLASAPTPTVLWQNVHVGASYDDVAAMYPEKVADPSRPGKMKRLAIHLPKSRTIQLQDTVTLDEDCRLQPRIHFDSNKIVKDVSLEGLGCRSLGPVLVGRYGKPTTSSSDTHTVPGLVLPSFTGGFHAQRLTSDTVETTNTLTWLMDGITITFRTEGMGAYVVYAIPPAANGLR